LTIVIVPDLQMRLLLLIATIAADILLRRHKDAQPSPRMATSGELPVLAVQALVLGAAWTIVALGWQQIDHSTVWQWRGWLAVTSIAALLAWSYRRALSPFIFAGIVTVAHIGVAYAMRTVHGIRINYGVSPDMIRLCEFVEQDSGRDAVFVVPPLLDDFQWRCRRAVFFTYAHLPLRLERHPEWFARLKLLRIVSPDLKPGDLKVPVIPHLDSYRQLAGDTFAEIARRYDNVEFALVPQRMQLELPLAYENASFRLYRLQPSR
jgi:hypothetical protein